MQEKLNNAQQSLQETIVEGKYRDNDQDLITVHMDGAHKVHHIKLHKQDAFASQEQLIDACAEAFNDAVNKVQDFSKKQISQIGQELSAKNNDLNDKG